MGLAREEKDLLIKTGIGFLGQLFGLVGGGKKRRRKAKIARIITASFAALDLYSGLEMLKARLDVASNKSAGMRISPEEVEQLKSLIDQVGSLTD